jgi:hypothetical protein
VSPTAKAAAKRRQREVRDAIQPTSFAQPAPQPEARLDGAAEPAAMVARGFASVQPAVGAVRSAPAPVPVVVTATAEKAWFRVLQLSSSVAGIIGTAVAVVALFATK